MCKTAKVTLSCVPASVASARRWVTAQLATMYGRVDDIAPEVQTIASELVTNAVRAECRHLSVALDGHHTYVRIATTDDAPGIPVQLEPGPDENHGRGLRVVDALSSEWGVERKNRSKTVWADVPLSADLAPTFECST